MLSGKVFLCLNQSTFILCPTGKRVIEVFGDAASLNASGHRFAKNAKTRQNLVWTPKGRLLFVSEEVVNEVCFGDE